MSMTLTLDMDAVDGMDQSTVESIISGMDMETLMIHVHAWQKRRFENKQIAATEMQNRAALLMVRRIRSMRELKNKTTRASAKAIAQAKAPLSVSDLGDF